MKPHQDPNHPLNGIKYLSGKKCVDCGKPAGTAWSPYWCQPCNMIRMDRISTNLESMMKDFDNE